MKFTILAILAATLSAHKLTREPSSIAEMMEWCDADGNEKISQEEFVKCVEKYTSPKEAREVKKSIKLWWSAVDMDGNGLSRDELKSLGLAAQVASKVQYKINY